MIEINRDVMKRNLGRVFVYLSLLTLGLLMTKSAIDNYLERKTTFEIQEIPLTFEDLPVITICYKIARFPSTDDLCHAQILNQSIVVSGTINGKAIAASVW